MIDLVKIAEEEGQVEMDEVAAEDVKEVEELNGKWVQRSAVNYNDRV